MMEQELKLEPIERKDAMPAGIIVGISAPSLFDIFNTVKVFKSFEGGNR